jgi:hypothetical protein
MVPVRMMANRLFERRRTAATTADFSSFMLFLCGCRHVLYQDRNAISIDDATLTKFNIAASPSRLSQ